MKTYDKNCKNGWKKWIAKIMCKFGNYEFTSLYSTVKAHLMKVKGIGVQICTKITPGIKICSQMQRELVEEERTQIDIPLPLSTQTIM